MREIHDRSNERNKRASIMHDALVAIAYGGEYDSTLSKKQKAARAVSALRLVDESFRIEEEATRRCGEEAQV